MTTQNTADRKPSKPWRVTITTASGDTTTSYRSEQKTYDAINSRTAAPDIQAGDRFTVDSCERGAWGSYERGVFTESSWE